eukprot:TRINITY_DN12719_c0_g1_i4.p1 TRINITY_DN12719_c0_g1~~TRINITY_DN12719_c0_g1_i4.p1  ORF type:complete len:229 (-),score=74.03 TRINITY_DN12719_c0_g1_i4:599-1243(-)
MASSTGSSSSTGRRRGRLLAPTLLLLASAHGWTLPISLRSLQHVRHSHRQHQKQHAGLISRFRGGGDGCPLMMAARGQVADASVPPGAEAAPETAKYNDAIKKYASGGEWAKAVVLIDKMREINLSPSIEAYGDTITALRRGLEFDRADALLADMYDACMPADLFAKYAAADPNDASSTQTQRVFALLLCMRTDQLEPDVDTYRAVMGMCTKDR